MLNYNLRFPFPSFLFLDRYRFFLNVTFLVKSVFSFFFSFFLDRCLFFLGRLLVRKRVFFLFYFLVFFYKFSSLFQGKSEDYDCRNHIRVIQPIGNGDRCIYQTRARKTPDTCTQNTRHVHIKHQTRAHKTQDTIPTDQITDYKSRFFLGCVPRNYWQ